MKLTPPQVKNLARRGLRLLIDPDPLPADKKRAFEFFEFKCAYCNRVVSRKNGDLDHLNPAARGGSNHISNRVPSCKKCNADEKREANWETFLRLKCNDGFIFNERKTLILHWIQEAGPAPIIPDAKLTTIEDEGRRISEEYDRAVHAVRVA